MRVFAAILVLLALAGAAPTAFAQGCVMCRQTAAAGGEEAARAFDLAILVLLIPTLSIFVGVLVYAFRRRNRSLLDDTVPPAETLSPPPYPTDFDEEGFRRSLRP